MMYTFDHNIIYKYICVYDVSHPLEQTFIKFFFLPFYISAIVLYVFSNPMLYQIDCLTSMIITISEFALVVVFLLLFMISK